MRRLQCCPKILLSGILRTVGVLGRISAKGPECDHSPQVAYGLSRSEYSLAARGFGATILEHAFLEVLSIYLVLLRVPD